MDITVLTGLYFSFLCSLEICNSTTDAVVTSGGITFCLGTMIISCSSSNCQTRMKKRSGISFHGFPVKQTQLLHK